MKTYRKILAQRLLGHPVMFILFIRVALMIHLFPTWLPYGWFLISLKMFLESYFTLQICVNSLHLQNLISIQFDGRILNFYKTIVSYSNFVVAYFSYYHKPEQGKVV